MSKFRKILVANRGEIAVRIIKTIHKLGYEAISIYSDIDRQTPHVIAADEAYPLNGVTPKDTYLNIDRIIDIAKQSGADAIHPGYGFLSENATFAAAVEKANITFIGPKPHSIAMMGDKITAKEAVSAYDVPLVPGIDKAVEDLEEAKSAAENIGFPVLIKASAGGGGKGMRIVHHADTFTESFQRAVSEAQSAFGDGRVFVEKYIEDPKHIEVQIMADNHGNIIHLFERECSIQRRHQKVIEEAPSPSIDPALRSELGKTAIKVAKACAYSGAGTVEFIMDKNKNFYFLEMNTRLQVEHPVTELISGHDLVALQISVAENNVLDVQQEDLEIQGHAIELRVYAEDPKNNFLPSPGRLLRHHIPHTPKTRVDAGVNEGNDISVYYDPMISKLVSSGKNRSEAIYNMVQAINEYKIRGVETTLEFGYFVMHHPDFQDGSYTTHFVENHFVNEGKEITPPSAEVIALIGAYFYQREFQKVRTPNY